MAKTARIVTTERAKDKCEMRLLLARKFEILDHTLKMSDFITASDRHLAMWRKTFAVVSKALQILGESHV